MLSNNFEYKVHNVVKDVQGCYLILDMEFLGERITLVNIYGPSDSDKPVFFLDVFEKIETIGNSYVIVGGDWNVILDPKLDARNYRSFTYRPRSRSTIKEIIDTFELIDVWREIFLDKRGYTWRRFNSVQQSRLDYFLVSDALLSEVNDVNIVPGYRSDHSIVKLGLKLNTERTRLRQYWKFNNSLLKDKTFVDIIKRLINDVKIQYAVPVYMTDNIKDILNEDIVFTIDDQLFFETLLMEIRGKAISYSTFKKRREKEEEDKLLNDINDLEVRDGLDQDSVILLEEKRHRLQELREKHLNGMIIRSRIQWLQEGEKPSRYFCNLENRNFCNKRMCFLEKDNGEMIFDENDVLNETKIFYETLYSEREVEEVDLSRLFNESPKLNDDERDFLEGRLTYAEIHAALRSMKNNKSPGSDGFTCEFFKFFLCDIGIFLLRSLNFGFSKGCLSVTQRQGVITCIPKDGRPKQFIKNWRPISLLNTTYKIASGCIANRIKCVLSKLIHPDQKGFMKGRYIGENIRMLYDILLYTDKENVPGLLFMADLEKAFDSISWKFIDKTLNFFNFGPDIVHWVHTFYSQISSCVSVNGRYSAWFKIARGVRQGDPLSCYLYLLCAEILSNMLRENEKVRGIKVGENEFLLSQFADDTALCLDGSEESFVEAVKILTFFAKVSGLKINYEKTQVIWIGSRKNCQVRYMRDRNFCWDPGTFKYLGVSFSTNVDCIVQLNYEGKLDEVRKLLSVWSKRQLTPFGKITVLKTLAISKLTYLFVNLPDPDDIFLKELDCMFFKFLWNGKQSKISKKHMCQSYERGGLKMLNVYVFLSCMKLSWLRRMFSSSDSTLKDFVLCLYPDLHKLHLLGGEFTNILMNTIHNPFWHDVLKYFKRLNGKCVPNDIHDFNAEFIFYNSNITVGHHTLYFKSWLNAGIFQVCHLLNDDGNYLPFDEFCGKYFVLKVNFLQYRGVIDAIRQYQNKLQVETMAGYKLHTVKIWKIINEGNNSVQRLFTDMDLLPVGIQKWNNTFIDLNWKQIFHKCHKVTGDCQLKWLQFRIIHRILPTNRYLFLRKIVDSPICSICQSGEETIVHLLWHCQHVAIFWNDLGELLKSKCTHFVNFHFQEVLVLFGAQVNVYTDSAFDMIVLFAKYYIYKCKWTNSKPKVHIFMKMLKNRYKLERLNSIRLDKIKRFDLCWKLYEALVVD